MSYYYIYYIFRRDVIKLNFFGIYIEIVKVLKGGEK